MACQSGAQAASRRPFTLTGPHREVLAGRVLHPQIRLLAAD